MILPSPFGSDFADQDFASTGGDRARAARLREELVRQLSGDDARRSKAAVTTASSAPTSSWNIASTTRSRGRSSSASRGRRTVPIWPKNGTAGSCTRTPAISGGSGNTKTNDFFTEAKSYGDEFRADNGFVPQVGYRSNYAEYGHTYWPKKDFFSRIRVFTMGQYDTLQDGSMLYRLAPSFGFGADGAHRSFIRLRYANDKVRNINPSSGIDTVFNRHQLLYSLQTGVNRLITFVSADGFVGQDVDFTNNRLGRGASMNLSVNLRPNDRFTIDLLHRQQWLTEPLAGRRRPMGRAIVSSPLRSSASARCTASTRACSSAPSSRTRGPR